jgi:ABC-type branched-subunit amino acid transport system ATPase component
VLLDEPAAGMNPAESLELNGLIQQIRARGQAVMLIEHHMSVVMGISDRIAVLEYGRKIAEGSPEAIRTNPQVVAAYLGSEEVT